MTYVYEAAVIAVHLYDEWRPPMMSGTFDVGGGKLGTRAQRTARGIERLHNKSLFLFVGHFTLSGAPFSPSPGTTRRCAYNRPEANIVYVCIHGDLTGS